MIHVRKPKKVFEPGQVVEVQRAVGSAWERAVYVKAPYKGHHAVNLDPKSPPRTINPSNGSEVIPLVFDGPTHNTWYCCVPTQRIRAVESKSPFWQSVGELATMRDQIPEERRALSGVREAMREDVLPRSTGIANLARIIETSSPDAEPVGKDGEDPDPREKRFPNAKRAREYVLGVAIAMLDAQIEHHPENVEGWMFGGVENAFDRRRVKKEIHRLQAELQKKLDRSRK